MGQAPFQRCQSEETSEIEVFGEYAEGLAHRGGYLEALLDGEPMVRGLLDNVLNRAALHELLDDVRLVVLLADVVHRDDVRMRAEAAHGRASRRTRARPDAPKPSVLIR